MITGCLSLQRLSMDSPVTHPVGFERRPPASDQLWGSSLSNQVKLIRPQFPCVATDGRQVAYRTDRHRTPPAPKCPTLPFLFRAATVVRTQRCTSIEQVANSNRRSTMRCDAMRCDAMRCMYVCIYVYICIYIYIYIHDKNLL